MPPVIFSNMVDGGERSSSVSSSAKSTPTLDVVGIPICSSTNGASLSQLGKTYHCQRCLNHGIEIPRKGHKRFCDYGNCECLKCSLVEERKILNREINSEREKNSSPINVDKADDISAKIRARNPKCARCGVHVTDVEPPPLKGHKKMCPYQNCTCRKCKLVTRRRSIMARQIHLRRTQKAKHSNSTNGEKNDSMATTTSTKSSTLPPSAAATTSQIPPNELPTPPNLTSSLCSSSSAPMTLRPSPTYPNVHCCHSAVMNNLNHQRNLQQQQACMQTSLSHLLTLNQQQTSLPPVCGHFHANAAVAAAAAAGLPQSIVDNLYLTSNPTLGLPMVSAATSPISANHHHLLFSPATASSILSELVLQRTCRMFPSAPPPPSPNAAALVSLGGMPVLPLTNDILTSALERMIAAVPSSWANQQYSSLASALRLPLFSNVTEEMHI